jgi:prepilin-type N-terminal cleavage/methylation domain-containing protein
MNRRGFSLLEVLVAVTLIGIGLSVVFAGMSGSVRGLARVESTEQRVDLARVKLAELDLIKKFRSRDSASGVFQDGTKWTVESSPFIPSIDEGTRRNPATVIQVDLTLEWMGRSEVQKQVIRTYRYQTVDATPIPALQDQLRDLE